LLKWIDDFNRFGEFAGRAILLSRRRIGTIHAQLSELDRTRYIQFASSPSICKSPPPLREISGMPCPEVIRKVVTGSNFSVAISLTHCDNGAYVVLEANFDPPRLGNSISLNGLLTVAGQRGAAWTSPKVTFHDDGRVTDYGDRSNGVRFPTKRFIIANEHHGGLAYSLRP
jgi:hypothetical protein